MRSKLFPDRCRELIYFAGEKRVGYEAIGEDWYQLDIHQFNQLRQMLTAETLMQKENFAKTG